MGVNPACLVPCTGSARKMWLGHGRSWGDRMWMSRWDGHRNRHSAHWWGRAL